MYRHCYTIVPKFRGVITEPFFGFPPSSVYSSTAHVPLLWKVFQYHASMDCEAFRGCEFAMSSAETHLVSLFRFPKPLEIDKLVLSESCESRPL